MGISIGGSEDQVVPSPACATSVSVTQIRHLPSYVTPIGKRNDTTDNPGAWGIPQGL
jgi:hypothetical protein